MFDVKLEFKIVKISIQARPTLILMFDIKSELNVWYQIRPECFISGSKRLVSSQALIFILTIKAIKSSEAHYFNLHSLAYLNHL